MANLYYKSGDEWLPLGGGSLPVGSYVYSDNNVSPAADMGGTWQSLGYTAVEPVVLWSAAYDDVSSVDHIYGSIYRHYDHTYGEVFESSAYGGVSLGLISPSLPKSNLTINLSSFSNTRWGWTYSRDYEIQTCTTRNLDYPSVNQNTQVLQLSYTTSEPLNSSIPGGKYLFKRTA